MRHPASSIQEQIWGKGMLIAVLVGTYMYNMIIFPNSVSLSLDNHAVLSLESGVFRGSKIEFTASATHTHTRVKNKFSLVGVIQLSKPTLSVKRNSSLL